HLELARLLLAQRHSDEAIEEFRIHLNVSPYGGRDDGFGDMYFARLLERAGYKKEAGDAYTRILAATKNESAFERCYLFGTLNLDEYQEFETVATEIKKL